MMKARLKLSTGPLRVTDTFGRDETETHFRDNQSSAKTSEQINIKINVFRATPNSQTGF